MTLVDGFDIALLLIILFFAVKGALKGFASELFSLVGVLGGIYAAYMYGSLVNEWLQLHFSSLNENIAWLVSIIVIFLAVNIVCSLAGQLIQLLLNATGLSALNGLTGFLLGAVKGLLIIVVLISVPLNLGLLTPSWEIYNSRFVQLTDKIILPYFRPLYDVPHMSNTASSVNSSFRVNVQ